MSDHMLAIIICGGSALSALAMLIWSWSLKGAAEDRSAEIGRLVREAKEVRDDMRVHRAGIEGAARIIERVANPPVAVKVKK